MSTLEEFAAGLDMAEVCDAASDAADMINLNGCALLDLCPGDMTRYRISVIPMKPLSTDERYHDAYWVGTQFGPSYEWHGGPMWDPGYVQSKWVNPAKAPGWTARVLCLFLTELAHMLEVNAEVPA